MSINTLNIIGAGKLGRYLGRAWHSNGVFKIGTVKCAGSAADAIAFIGAGTEEYIPADITLIATPDDKIGEASRGVTGMVFHCSGALPSSILHGGPRASVHPVKSFADPQNPFAGTWCGAEGDSAALDILIPAFGAIGGKIFRVEPSQKTLYHAASVLACNGLPPLMESALACMERAGIGRETALQILEPLVTETARNIFAKGPAAALTGPAARGDLATLNRQHDALAAQDADIAALYDALARLASRLVKN